MLCSVQYCAGPLPLLDLTNPDPIRRHGHSELQKVDVAKECETCIEARVRKKATPL